MEVNENTLSFDKFKIKYNFSHLRHSRPDVMITLPNGDSIPTHKFILSGASRKMCKLFTDNPNLPTIDLSQNIEKNDIELWLDFIYGVPIKKQLNINNIINFFSISIFFSKIYDYNNSFEFFINTIVKLSDVENIDFASHLINNYLIEGNITRDINDIYIYMAMNYNKYASYIPYTKQFCLVKIPFYWSYDKIKNIMRLFPDDNVKLRFLSSFVNLLDDNELFYLLSEYISISSVKNEIINFIKSDNFFLRISNLLMTDISSILCKEPINFNSLKDKHLNLYYINHPNNSSIKYNEDDNSEFTFVFPQTMMFDLNSEEENIFYIIKLSVVLDNQNKIKYCLKHDIIGYIKSDIPLDNPIFFRLKEQEKHKLFLIQQSNNNIITQ